MSLIPTLPVSISTATPMTTATAAPSPSSPDGISIALAVGLVLCPAAFIFITAAFCYVARKGDVCPRLLTARLRRDEAERQRDYAKYMSRGRRSTSASQLPPPLPLYTPTAVPPAYIPRPKLPPYE